MGKENHILIVQLPYSGQVREQSYTTITPRNRLQAMDLCLSKLSETRGDNVAFNLSGGRLVFACGRSLRWAVLHTLVYPQNSYWTS